MRRAAAIAVVAAALSAPAAAQAPSGLYGTVTQGPTTPVCKVGLPCDKPAKGAAFQLSRSGKSWFIHTSPTGHYRVRLKPGRYSVSRVAPGPGSIKPTSVRVPAGRYARVNFRIDTGIR